MSVTLQWEMIPQVKCITHWKPRTNSGMVQSSRSHMGVWKSCVSWKVMGNAEAERQLDLLQEETFKASFLILPHWHAEVTSGLLHSSLTLNISTQSSKVWSNVLLEINGTTKRCFQVFDLQPTQPITESSRDLKDYAFCRTNLKWQTKLQERERLWFTTRMNFIYQGFLGEEGAIQRGGKPRKTSPALGKGGFRSPPTLMVTITHYSGSPNLLDTWILLFLSYFKDT